VPGSIRVIVPPLTTMPPIAPAGEPDITGIAHAKPVPIHIAWTRTAFVSAARSGRTDVIIIEYTNSRPFRKIPVFGPRAHSM
jgi:hypothetical protein